MRSCPPRLLGFLLLLASGGTTLIHRSIYEAARHGPAQVAEMAAGLTTFMLASTGILLLIHGARLFERSAIGLSAKRKTRRRDLISILAEPITPAGTAYDTRRGVAVVQAHQALMLAAPSARRARVADADIKIDRQRR